MAARSLSMKSGQTNVADATTPSVFQTPRTGPIRRASIRATNKDVSVGGDGNAATTLAHLSSKPTIQTVHTHHYHYHLYQTTIQEGGGGRSNPDDADDEAEEEEDAELAELMELFPDGIPDELLMNTDGVPQEVVDEEGNVITVIQPRRKAVKNIFGVHDLSPKEIESLTAFARVYRFLHDPQSGRFARMWSVLMVLAIVVSSVMILLQSMPNLGFIDAIDRITKAIELYSVCLFTVDYLLKLFSVHSYADCILPKPLPYNVLFRFFIHPFNLLDFISVIPFWIQMVLGVGATSQNTISFVFRIVRMLRIVRLLKVAQYSRSIDIFFRVIIQAWDALLLLLFFVGFGSIVFGTLIFICEKGELQTDRTNNATFGKYMRPTLRGDGLEESPFTSIPQSFWYVVTTLTTVGYGDMTPTTFVGQIVGGCTMLSGVLFISTPLVIFGTHFQNEFTKELERQQFIHRREAKIQKRQEEKERKRKQREKAQKEQEMMMEGAQSWDNDLATSMGLSTGTGTGNLPGQVPQASPKNDPFGNNDPFNFNKPQTNTNNNSGLLTRRTSVMLTGRGSIYGGANNSGSDGLLTNRGGGVGGGGGGDVSINIGNGMTPKLGPRMSIYGGSGGGNLLMSGTNNTGNNAPGLNMGMYGGVSNTAANACSCPCTCGQRNPALSSPPGSSVIGGVRRSVFAKSSNGGRMSLVGSPTMNAQPTAADQAAIQKGMNLATQVLPPKEVAEQSAAQMASASPTTLATSLSAAHIIEMQSQLDSLRTLVAQLGGLLLAGGAPAPQVASAMLVQAGVPSDQLSTTGTTSTKGLTKKRSSIMKKTLSGAALSTMTNLTGETPTSTQTPVPVPVPVPTSPATPATPSHINPTIDVNSPLARNNPFAPLALASPTNSNSTPSARNALTQPSSGKLVPRTSPSPMLTAITEDQQQQQQFSDQQQQSQSNTTASASGPGPGPGSFNFQQNQNQSSFEQPGLLRTPSITGQTATATSTASNSPGGTSTLGASSASSRVAKYDSFTLPAPATDASFIPSSATLSASISASAAAATSAALSAPSSSILASSGSNVDATTATSTNWTAASNAGTEMTPLTSSSSSPSAPVAVAAAATSSSISPQSSTSPGATLTSSSSPSAPASSTSPGAATSVSASASASASVSPPVAAAPVPVPVPVPDGPPALSIEQIIPARPVHRFPPALTAHESTIDKSIRLLDSLLGSTHLAFTHDVLSRPTFRFILDIVINMIRVHSFPDAYFDPSELDHATYHRSGTAGDAEAKLEFLDKLVDLVAIINQNDLSAIHTKKIVAGLEPERTNQLLQEFAIATATGISVEQITAMMAAQEQAGMFAPLEGEEQGQGHEQASSQPSDDKQALVGHAAPSSSSPRASPQGSTTNIALPAPPSSASASPSPEGGSGDGDTGPLLGASDAPSSDD